MKRIFAIAAAVLLATAAAVSAQDAATEERFRKLSAQIQDLIDARDAQNKRIEELSRAINSLQQQLNKPNSAYASQADLKHLADKLQEVDRKRQEDNDRILRGVEKEIKALGSSLRKPTPAPSTDPAPSTPDRGYEYVVQPGDTLSLIVAAYREQNIKVTVDQVLKANPGLVPEKMKVGQKIFIPAP